MPVYEFCIAIKDEVDHTPGKYRKREGDIVTVRPKGWKWGFKEIDEYLIVPIECDETDESKIRQKFRQPLLENDHVEGETFGKMHPGEPLAKTHVINLSDGKLIFWPAELGKNKYKIPLGTLGLTKDELAKVADKTCKFQPFLTVSEVVKPFDGKNNNRYLEEKDVDCAAVSVVKERYKKFPWLKATDNKIYDKAKSKYVKPNETLGVALRI